MCFSATASFAAAGGLFIVGSLAIAKGKTTPQRILGAMPLLFSVQQCSEGLLWLSLSHPAYQQLYYIGMYTFLFFAQVIWPCYVPLTVLLLERSLSRKKILRFLLGVGVFSSAYLTYCLLVHQSSAVIDHQHIVYHLDFPYTKEWYSGIPYLLAAVLSPFISGLRSLRWLGLILLVSYVITQLFYKTYLISVWCYFAAILSLVVLLIVLNLRKVRTP